MGDDVEGDVAVVDEVGYDGDADSGEDGSDGYG